MSTRPQDGNDSLARDFSRVAFLLSPKLLLRDLLGSPMFPDSLEPSKLQQGTEVAQHRPPAAPARKVWNSNWEHISGPTAKRSPS